MEPWSNSQPEFRSSAAMADASPKVGGLRPTSLQLKMMCFPWVLVKNISDMILSLYTHLALTKMLQLKGNILIFSSRQIYIEGSKLTTPPPSVLWRRIMRVHFLSYLYNRFLSLSPTLITMTSLPAPVSLAISFLMILATLEWMAPQRPRSDVTPMIRCLATLSSGTLISAFSYRAGDQNQKISFYAILSADWEQNPARIIRHLPTPGGSAYVPRAPLPYTLAGFSCLSAREYLAAATIFIDFVIFWMFLMDFNRMVTKGREDVAHCHKHG